MMLPLSQWNSRYWLLLVVGVVLCTACSQKPKPVTVPATLPPKETTEVTPPAVTPPPVTTVEAVDLKDVFFDYDKSALREDAQGILTADGKLLVDNSGTRVLLEGHCDERGTVEYNLALGQRRADAAKAYLIQYGVDAGRLSTISYGEEKPFALGTGEAVWAQNRRVHFVKQ